MISDRPRSRNPAGRAGLLENLLALVSALADFFESRFALHAEESKVAAVQVLILVGCLIFALLLSALGYVFLITGGCGAGPFGWDFMAMDRAGRCRSAFHYCAG